MRVAVVGSYGAGLTMRTPRTPVAGETISGGEFSSGHGGKGSNQAVAAARLGAQVSLLTSLGDDAFAADARALWAVEGVDASAVVTSRKATMAGFIMVEPSGENRIIIASGALDDLDAEACRAFEPAIANADVLLCCLEVPVEPVETALRIAKQHRVRTILNPAPAPTQPLPDGIWDLIDVLTPNQTEAKALVGADPEADLSPEQCADLLRERFAGTIVMTLGAEGALVDEPAGRTRCASVPTPQVVDTTGAGDAFNGALAVALARGDSLAEAVRYASAAGAHAVSVAEVIPSLAHPADIDQLLK